MRRFLDRLYAASGAFAAVCLASIAVVMLAQAGMREFGLLLRGADDIVAWLCAAAAFLALGHTFRRGELVRVGLLLEHLPPRPRRVLEVTALALTVVFVGYMAYATLNFVHDSWKFKEVAQGLIRIPIWIPQLSAVIGVLILFIAVLDDFICLLRGATPGYQAAEDERRTSKDFSESL
ncbi:MAG: TRAP transporter small permease [Betaproteobacteria bacterium]|nr:TRAP transporter small permease [Betaproteobacteria bacterium]